MEAETVEKTKQLEESHNKFTQLRNEAKQKIKDIKQQLQEMTEKFELKEKG
jgi:hypothetical protein